MKLMGMPSSSSHLFERTEQTKRRKAADRKAMVQILIIMMQQLVGVEDYEHNCVAKVVAVQFHGAFQQLSKSIKC